MNGSKEIIVVSPDQYKDLARKLSHEISKVPGCNGAFWNIKQFEENEFQLGGNRYAIFIGNADENSITKDFLPVIKKINNKAGACYGFDGTKALIFGEGKLDQREDFKNVLKESAAITVGTSAFSTVGAGIAATSVVFLPIYLRKLLPWPILVFSYFRRKKREKELRTEQTKAALTLFLAENFDEWIGLKK